MKSPHTDAKRRSSPSCWLLVRYCQWMQLMVTPTNNDFTSQKIILSALCEVNLYLEKRILIPRKVSLKYRGVPFVEFYFFQAQCLALTHPHSYFLVSNDQCLLCSDQASQLSPALPISCFPTSRHRCESLLRDSQTHRWTHSNSAALDWSWRGKSRSWIKIWDARLRWSPSLLQFPGCNCDIRRLLLTVLDGTRRKDHSGHSNVLLVNTQ